MQILWRKIVAAGTRHIVEISKLVIFISISPGIAGCTCGYMYRNYLKPYPRDPAQVLPILQGSLVAGMESLPHNTFSSLVTLWPLLWLRDMWIRNWSGSRRLQRSSIPYLFIICGSQFCSSNSSFHGCEAIFSITNIAVLAVTSLTQTLGVRRGVMVLLSGTSKSSGVNWSVPSTSAVDSVPTKEYLASCVSGGVTGAGLSFLSSEQ